MLSCPKCGSENIIKKGKKDNKQRIYCKDCERYSTILIPVNIGIKRKRKRKKEDNQDSVYILNYIKSKTDVLLILKNNKKELLFKVPYTENIEELIKHKTVTFSDLFNSTQTPDILIRQLNSINMNKFMERLNKNPYDDIKHLAIDFVVNNFIILEDGSFVGYKYVKINKKGQIVSVYDNKTVHEIGKFVEVQEYDHDPTITCGKGLHVASHKYLKFYSAGDIYLAVQVYPEDIVSIPLNEKDLKMRVRRYKPLFTMGVVPSQKLLLETIKDYLKI